MNLAQTFYYLIEEPLLIVLISFALIFIIQLFYYWFFYSRLAFFKAKSAEVSYEPVSVVIAAHNEAWNLEQNLPSILEQDYHDFEVIVVNDRSDDESDEVLSRLKEKYSHLNVVNVKQSVVFYKGKKFPLSVGIKSAKNELLLLTDADCRPATNQWIKKMLTAYTPETEIVLGYGPYEKRKGLLNLLIRYDAFQIAIQYFSFALAGLPYMGVGRNLSYKKSLFYRHKGFINHYNIPSGDDDLFINAAATRTNTTIARDPDAHVFSSPKTNLSSWIRQKRRHFTTGRFYKPFKKRLLGMLAISGVLYYPLFLLLIVTQYYWWYVLGAHVLRLVSRILLFGFSAKKLSESKLYLFSPLFDPFFTFFNPLLVLSSLVFKPRKWN
jgi:glycosyltransferase involved in cell wall biosynthesis